MTETMTFEVSQDLLASLKMGIQDLAQEIRLMAAISYFQEKKLSLGKAADLAGCNRFSFMDILAQKGIVIFDYDESIVDSELQGVAQFSQEVI